jgi:hypothetical protein
VCFHVFHRFMSSFTAVMSEKGNPIYVHEYFLSLPQRHYLTCFKSNIIKTDKPIKNCAKIPTRLTLLRKLIQEAYQSTCCNLLTPTSVVGGFLFKIFKEAQKRECWKSFNQICGHLRSKSSITLERNSYIENNLNVNAILSFRSSILLMHFTSHRPFLPKTT